MVMTVFVMVMTIKKIITITKCDGNDFLRDGSDCDGNDKFHISVEKDG